METYPNLVVICALQDLIEELNRMIQADLNAPILLSYDTTFCLGDIYVSPFLYRHVLFDSSPVIPAAFLLHERKFKCVHDTFMAFIRKELHPWVMLLHQSPLLVIMKEAFVMQSTNT